MSVTKQCQHLKVDESTFIECESVKQSNNITRRMGQTERLPKNMEGWEFTCVTFTAIAIQKGHVIYLNKVTRTK